MSEQLERILTDYEQENFLCGNILITQEGKEVIHRSFGHASIQQNVPNTVDTKFHIASVTKMFIASAALILVEQGLLDLDEHPGTYYERFKVLHPDIRIRHLLNHSSGLHDIYAVSALRFEMSRLVVEKRDFIDYLVQLPQDFQPGERWSYSSTGFIMMGYILETVTGKSFEEVFHAFFFSPLGMRATGVDYPRKVNPGRAYGHTTENGKLINADNDRLSEIVDASGELYSTTRDLDKWCDALFHGKLLSQASLRQMFTPYYITTFDPKLHYGLGWFLGSDVQLIIGGTPGFRSEIRYYPASDIRVIMLWNYEKVNTRQLFLKLEPALTSVK